MSERLESDFGDCLYQITTYYGLLGRSLTLKMKMLLYLSKCLSAITSVTAYYQLNVERGICHEKELYIGYFELLPKHVSSDRNYVAVQLKKTSLTSLPNSSIDRVIFFVARRGGGGRLTIPSKIGLRWEGEKHGGVSQWETEMIKRLSLLTEKRGLVSIAPSFFHGLV